MSASVHACALAKRLSRPLASRSVLSTLRLLAVIRHAQAGLVKEGARWALLSPSYHLAARGSSGCVCVCVCACACACVCFFFHAPFSEVRLGAGSLCEKQSLRTVAAYHIRREKMWQLMLLGQATAWLEVSVGLCDSGQVSRWSPHGETSLIEKQQNCFF